MEPLIGTILLWAVPWIPVGWLACQGQLLPIAQYQMLYSLIGKNYGGDGVTNFQLPDLRGMVPVGAGSSPFGYYVIGDRGGNINDSFAMTTNNLPSHTHSMSNAYANVPPTSADVTVTASTDIGERSVPQNNDYLGANDMNGRPVNLYRGDANNSVILAGATAEIPAITAPVTGNVGNTGNGQPVSVSTMQPYTVINYIIAYEGIYPQRP